MAINAKPNVKGLRKEGKITFESTDYHGGSNADKVESLLDGNTDKISIYGVLVSSNPKSHFKFTLHQDSNVWAYGQHYSDSTGSTPKTISLYKQNRSGVFEKIKDNIQTYSNQWYLLFENLPKGSYQIKNQVSYCQFTEWYIEKLTGHKFLLKQNNQLYTIKSEFYEPSKSQYKPITEIDINNITDEDLKKYGFDDIGDILTETDIGEDKFKPIEKLKTINDGKFDILVKGLNN